MATTSVTGSETVKQLGRSQSTYDRNVSRLALFYRDIVQAFALIGL